MVLHDFLVTPAKAGVQKSLDSGFRWRGPGMTVWGMTVTAGRAPRGALGSAKNGRPGGVLRARSFILAACAAGLLAACAGSVEDRIGSADAIAARANLARQTIRTDTFTLVAFERIQARGGPLAVYIEGDGKAWSSRTMLSTNPTPEKPVALELAARDPAPNVVYIARPCQYLETGQDPRCTEAYWSSRRFAPEVIAATGQAIEHFKRRAGAETIHLIGFSGGAAVAALVAAKRSDVASLRTVAGNLDHVALHNYHKVSQLRGSLNALDVAAQLGRLPQVHFSGGRDEIVPAFIARRFADAAGDSPCIRLVSVAGAAHEQGWAEAWPGLVRTIPSCSGPPQAPKGGR